MNAKFTVILKKGQPWIRWEQEDIKYLRIWNAKSDSPYCKYNGIVANLTNEMKQQLQKIYS